MTLRQGKIGSSYKIKDIKLTDSAKKRFEILGMTKGSDVIIVNQKPSGPLIVKIRGTRFAIGKEFADGIIIGGKQ